MKTFLMTAFGIVAALLFVAEAKETGKSSDRKNQRLGKMVLQKYDRDHNGKLNEEEATVARKEMERERAMVLKKYDLNRDGKLDAREKMAARRQILQNLSKVLRKYDADGDGKLSAREKADRKKELLRIVSQDSTSDSAPPPSRKTRKTAAGG